MAEEKGIPIDGRAKTVQDVWEVAYRKEPCYIPRETRENLQRSRERIETLLRNGERAYGVNTGFGKFQNVIITSDNITKLQENLLLSHAAGVGEPFSIPEVRAAMFLRANALARGASGVRVEIVERLKDLLNLNVTPWVPQKGSVGASGDLAPLSHIGLVIVGRGKAFLGEELLPAGEALEKVGLKPMSLEAKEGLALTNGVQMSLAVLMLACFWGYRLATAADIISSLTGQALSCIPWAYDEVLISMRPHPGATDVAFNLRKLLQASSLTSTPGEVRMQDPYVLRCIPQVHGAFRQALYHVAQVCEIESASATDNPLVLPDGRVVSGGNFHGQPLSVAGDYLGLSFSSLANMAERRIARLIDENKSGLPPFLTRQGGLNSGFMLWQYTAASLASECKVLAHPASVDTIPTSADQEDHVSMSTIAARKALDIADNVLTILAIEYVAACQAIEFRGPEKLSPGTKEAYRLLRKWVLPLEEDREMGDDMGKARQLIKEGLVQEAVEGVLGPLK